MRGWPSSGAGVSFREVNPEIKHRVTGSQGVTLVFQERKGSATLLAVDSTLDAVARLSAAESGYLWPVSNAHLCPPVVTTGRPIPPSPPEAQPPYRG